MADVNLGNIFATLTIDGEEFDLVIDESKSQLTSLQSIATTAFSLPGKAINLFGKLIGGIFTLVKKLVTGFFSLRTAIVGAFGAFTAQRLAQLAADIDNTQTSFDALVKTIDSGATFALERLRASVRGTVSDLELMQIANTALVLGVARSTEDFETLGNAARRLGQATGRTAAEGFRDLVTGIGRASPLILDNLGIIIKVGEANEVYADKLGKTVEALTDAEKRTAFQEAAFLAMDAALLKLGDDTDTFGDKFSRIGANFSNFTARIARGTIPTLSRLGEALGGIVTTGVADRISQLISNLVDDFTLLVTEVGPRAIKFFERLIEIVKELQNALSAVLRITFARLFEFIEDPALAVDAVSTFFAGFLLLVEGLARAAGRIFVETFLEALSKLSEGDSLLAETLRILGVKPISAILLDPKVTAQRAEAVIREAGLIATGIAKIRESIVGDSELAEEGVDKFTAAVSRLVNLFTGGDLPRGARNLEELAEEATALFVELATGNFDGISDALIFLDKTIGPIRSEVERLEKSLAELKAQDVSEADILGVEAGTIDIDDTPLRKIEEIRQELEKVRGTLDQLGVLETFTNAIKARIDAIKELASAATETQSEADKQAQETAESLREQNVELQKQLEIEFKLREAAQGGAEDLDELRQIAELIQANEEIVELLEQQGVSGPLAAQITQFLSNRLSLTLSILSAIRQQKQALDDTKEVEEELAETTKERERLTQSLVNAVEKLQEGADQEFFEASIAGLTELEQALATVEREFSELRIDIQEADVPQDVKDDLEKKLSDGLEISTDGIKLNFKTSEQKEVEEQFKDIANSFGQDFTRAILAGEDPLLALAGAFASAFEEQLTKVIGELSENLSGLFTDLLGGGTGLGGFVGSLAGIGLALGASALLGEGSSATVTDLPIEEVVTSQSAVRGVVAGPDTVAIAEIGSSIREANRGVESLLKDIRDLLQNAVTGGILDPSGVGAAGTV